MGRNRGINVTMLIPKMRYTVSSFILYFSLPPHPPLFEPEVFEGEGISFVSMAIPIPEARRLVNRIYQFPGNAHLNKIERIPAITITHR
jgi:hypothetical protein